MSRVLARLLRLTLALLLGLGPLAIEGLAQLAHAPLCSCCASEPLERGCCAKADEGGASGPEVRAPRKACACSLALPEAPSAPSTTPRVSETRSALRTQLERAQRAQLVPLCASWLALAARVRPPGAAPGAGPPRRAHGAERAAALGVLRL